MANVVVDARRVLDFIVDGDIEALAPMHSERLKRWVAQGELQRYVARCTSDLVTLVGREWQVVSAWSVTPQMARFEIQGDDGRAVVTVRFNEQGRLDGYGVDAQQPRNGIGNISVACPTERVEELAAFYGRLAPGARVSVGESGSDYVAPQWGDPDRPQQMHLDIFVGDLDAAHRECIDAGASPLHSGDGYRVYTDPVGHAFCLYADARQVGSVGVLGRIMIDCLSPRALAHFYEGLLQMDRRVEDTHNRVVVAGADGTLPMLGFQRVAPYVPPRWGDPRYPQQMHFDMFFDDGESARALAERLGAVPLAPLGGSCPVYADPAGHPFCLCLPYE